MVPTKKASTSEDAEAAAVARQNQLNEQQAQGFLYFFLLRTVYILVRVRPRFFDQVGHQTNNASIRNKYFFNKLCHHQTYQNYEQSRQKLGTFLVNKVL